MYHLLTSLYTEWTRRIEYNVLILGLEGAGKTALLEKIKSEYTSLPALALSKLTPTVGQNVLDVPLAGTSTTLHFWDLGGAAPLRRLWVQYYTEAHAIVWVIDGLSWSTSGTSQASGKGKEKQVDSSSGRLELEEVLEAVLRTAELSSTPIVFVVSKMDQTQAADTSSNISSVTTSPLVEEVHSWLESRISSVIGGSKSGPKPDAAGGVIADERLWTVIGTDAASGAGISSVVAWLREASAREKQGV